MPFEILTPERHARQPWKNGGGTTAEVARRDLDGRLLWRVSIAAVEASGPFSDFSGYERTLMLLSGRGMSLSFDRAPARDLEVAFVPFTFAGEWKTDCRLIDGPVEDFNLMVDRGRARASLDVLELDEETRVLTSGREAVLVFILLGRARLTTDCGEHVLNARDAVVFEEHATAAVHGALSLAAIDRPCRIADIHIALR